MGDVAPDILQQPSLPENSINNQQATEKLSAFPGNIAEGMMERQKKRGLPLVIVNTDIDNSFKMSSKTETPDEKDASERLACTAWEADVPMHAITGAGYEDVMKRIDTGELPWFPVLSTNVGTRRFVLQVEEDGRRSYIEDPSLAEKLAKSGYDRRKLAQQCVGEAGASGIFSILNGTYSELELDFQHPADERKFINEEGGTDQPYKLSGYFFAKDEELAGIVNRMQEMIPGQRIVVCEEIGYNASLQPGEKRKKRCLDIVPITKAEALADVASTLGAQVAITTGDSGNDITMLQDDVTNVAVIAGGAKQELITAMEGEFAEASGKSIKEKKIRDKEKKLLFRERTNEGRRGPNTTLHALDVVMRASQIHMDTVMNHYNLNANSEYKEKKEWLEDKRAKVQGKKPIDPLVRNRVYSAVHSK